MPLKLDNADKQALALWAAACAERVLPHFEAARPDDPRPRLAIEAARAFARGESGYRAGRAAAVAAHAAAREADEGAPRFAARAAGHAAATAHSGRHAAGAAWYALKAVGAAAAAAAVASESEWQSRSAPERLRAVAFPDQRSRRL